MDEKLLALLEKSRLFKGLESRYYYEALVNSPEKFRFWLPNCFRERANKTEQIECLTGVLVRFIRRYLESWVRIIRTEPSKKPFDWESYCSNIMSFFSNFESEKFFDQISSGEKVVTIPITPNNSNLVIQRVGNVLAFNLLRDGENEHITGVKAVEALCRENDPHNNQGVYELVHDVEINLSIPHYKDNGGERAIDFTVMWDMLKKSLCFIDLELDADSLIHAYKEMDRAGIAVGKYFDLPIHAKLIHLHAKKKEDISHENYYFPPRAKTWRQGNVKKISGSKYHFSEADDLHIVLSLKGSVPSSFWEKVDVSFDIHREQFILANAGAIICTQLSAMMLNAYQKQSIGLGN